MKSLETKTRKVFHSIHRGHMKNKKGLIIDGAENFESPLQILDFIKRNV